jgi:hypothetical protein
MLDRILRRMRKLVLAAEYVVTIHAGEEMEADGLVLFDIEHCILTGEVVEKQRDQRTLERKYLVRGNTLAGGRAVVVAKIGPTGKLVIVTAYLL